MSDQEKIKALDKIYNSDIRAQIIKEEYYMPDEQINNTQNYNEMDFYRYQDGERKQPDNCILFKHCAKSKFCANRNGDKIIEP